MDITEAKRIMRQELNKWGLHKWKGIVDKRPKRRLGQCRRRKKEIGVSLWLLSPENEHEILDTIRHEVAHVLAGGIAKHGPVWKAWAVKVGARPIRCAKSENLVLPPKPAGKWVAHCPACGQEFRKHKRPRPGRKYLCCKHRRLLEFTLGGVA